MPCRTVTVTSFKGGVGKSTVAANLALFLAASGKKTMLVDCDFRMRSLDIFLGLEDEIVYDAGDVLEGNVALEKAVISDKRQGGLLFLPAPFDYREGLDAERFKSLLDEAKDVYSLDIIILDTPGTSGEEFSAAAACSDTAYVVATHSFPSIRAAETTGRELEKMGVKERYLLINMFDTSGKDGEKKPAVVDIIDKTCLRLGGIVPYDPKLTLLQDKGELADSLGDHNIARSFENLCKRIEGKNVPLFTGFKRINKKKLLG